MPKSVAGERAERIMARLEELGGISSERGSLTRLYLTEEHRAANALVGRWMQDAGMQVRTDPLGTLIGRYEGEKPGLPALLIGSHLDTVRGAGRYDGALGVVLAIACVEALHHAGERLGFAIEVVAFGDEEGVRFQAGLLGSRALAGSFGQDALALRDAAGMTLAEVMTDFGLDPRDIGRAARAADEVLAYLEVHIEQGPVLEAADIPVGVVTGISGASRFQIEATGRSGHAGTVPMGMRQDALAAAAEMILAIEALCRPGGEVVGTTGEIEVWPGAVNVIPGRVRFSVDMRAPEDAQRLEAVREMKGAIAEIGRRRRVETGIHPTYEVRSCQCSPDLTQELAEAVRAEGIAVAHLPSGAGHDAMALAELTEVAMLFVRCEGGVSHDPAESVAAPDVEVATRVVLRFLRSFGAGR